MQVFPRTLASAALSLLLLAAAAPAALAQDEAESEQPEYVVLSTAEVSPPNIDAFTEIVAEFRQLAMDAGIGADFRWDVYSRDNEFVLVSWRETMATFDDPQAFMRQFEGEYAERLPEIFQRMEDVEATWVTSVLRPRQDWSYQPAEVPFAEGQQGGVFVFSQWPGRASEEEFAASAENLIGFIDEVGYAYPLYAFQVMLGDEHVEFVVAFDTPAGFYGENSLGTLVEGAGRMDEWEGLVDAHNQLLADTDSQVLFYRPELSYRPDLQVASAGGDGG
ncbi:MAG TPA: hypothetical protein VK837_04040 [Longimicrobiales bacterium]|nr:hypothetical protein [Longimicrobiales bacterium]